MTAAMTKGTVDRNASALTIARHATGNHEPSEHRSFTMRELTQSNDSRVTGQIRQWAETHPDQQLRATLPSADETLELVGQEIRMRNGDGTLTEHYGSRADAGTAFAAMATALAIAIGLRRTEPAPANQ